MNTKKMKIALIISIVLFSIIPISIGGYKIYCEIENKIRLETVQEYLDENYDEKMIIKGTLPYFDDPIGWLMFAAIVYPENDEDNTFHVYIDSEGNAFAADRMDQDEFLEKFLGR